MKTLDYNKGLLRTILPNLHKAFHPFAVSPPDGQKGKIRTALLEEKVTGDYTIAIGTCRNGQFEWLSYKSPRGSSHKPRRIVFRDYNNDGEPEVDIVWYGKETKRDKAGMFISSKEVDIHTILKVSDEKIVPVEELIKKPASTSSI